MKAKMLGMNALKDTINSFIIIS